jgi:transcriptional regulator with XRE-family HTH domain
MNDLLQQLATSKPPVGEPRLDPWKLRIARELRGLTQRALAAEAGYTNGHNRICRIERYSDENAGVGHGRGVAFRLAAALDVRVEDLCSDDETIAANRNQHDAWRATGMDLREWAKKQGGEDA